MLGLAAMSRNRGTFRTLVRSGVAPTPMYSTMTTSRPLEFATTYLRMAEQASDPSQQLLFLDMAMVWRRLAKQAEKNSRLDLVYETP